MQKNKKKLQNLWLCATIKNKGGKIMPWLDILAIGVLIVFALSGFFKGFWRNFISLFSSVVVIVLSILLAKPLSNLLEMWFGAASNIAASMQPGFEDYFLNNDWHSGWMYAVLLVFLGKPFLDTDPDATTLANAFSGAVSKILLCLICIVVVFCIIKLVLWLILKFTSKLNTFKPHRALDRIFGVVLGVVKGFFAIISAAAVLFAIGSIIPPMAGWLDGMYATNPVAKWLYDISVYIVQNWIFPFLLH